jgi:hypothetical protein
VSECCVVVDSSPSACIPSANSCQPEPKKCRDAAAAAERRRRICYVCVCVCGQSRGKERKAREPKLPLRLATSQKA